MKVKGAMLYMVQIKDINLVKKELLPLSAISKMKKFLIVICLTFSVLGLQAQNRKQLSQFSLFQHYFNPAMTGYEGSQIKTLYREQWIGFENAPKTVLLSGELDLDELEAAKRPGPLGTKQAGSKGALGLVLFNDSFGPFHETHFNLSYGSQVRLSEQLRLRAGATASYAVSNLNRTKVLVDDETDPEYINLLGTDNNQTHKLDVNAGLTLMGEDFYVGYAIHDLAKGRLITGDDYYKHIYPLHHVVQAGYRSSLSDEFGLVLNGIYRYDEKLKTTVEGQLKGVWNNTIWGGIGYRYNQALTFQAGMQLSRFRLGYAREQASGQATINAGTNELMLSYSLTPKYFARPGRKLSIW